MSKYLFNAAADTHVVVKPSRPLRKFLFWTAGCVALSVIVYIICLSGFNSLMENRFAINMDEKTLQALNIRLTSQNNRLRDRVAILKRVAQVDRIAYQEISKTVEVLQEELREYRADMLFYQRLLASSGQRQDLSVQSLELWPEDDENTYHYRIVLTRFMRNDTVVRGTVRLSVIGRREEASDDPALPDVTVESPEKLAFEFKNFQRIEGYLVLPEGFTPRRLAATIDLQGKKPKQITKTMDWSDAIK